MTDILTTLHSTWPVVEQSKGLFGFAKTLILSDSSACDLLCFPFFSQILHQCCHNCNSVRWMVAYQLLNKESSQNLPLCIPPPPPPSFQRMGLTFLGYLLFPGSTEHVSTCLSSLLTHKGPPNFLEGILIIF